MISASSWGGAYTLEEDDDDVNDSHETDDSDSSGDTHQASDRNEVDDRAEVDENSNSWNGSDLDQRQQEALNIPAKFSDYASMGASYTIEPGVLHGSDDLKDALDKAIAALPAGADREAAEFFRDRGASLHELGQQGGYAYGLNREMSDGSRDSYNVVESILSQHAESRPHLENYSHINFTGDTSDLPNPGLSDPRAAAGDAAAAADTPAAQTTAASDVRAAREVEAADLLAASHSRFEEIGLYDLNPNYARVTSGIEYLRSSQENLNAQLGFNVSDIPDLSEQRGMSLNVSLMGNDFSAGFGQSAQHKAVDQVVEAFKEMTHAAGNNDLRNFWDATGVADGILSKYHITYENLEAKAAYRTDHLNPNPEFKDMVTGGERDVLAGYHAQVRDAFRDYANGDASHAQATQRVLNAMDNLEKYMDHIGLTDGHGNISESRGLQYEADRKDHMIAALQHRVAELSSDSPAANFAREDGLSQFVASFEHMSDDQRSAFSAAALQGRIIENLNFNLPETDQNNGINAMRDAIIADYPTLFQEAALGGNERLNDTKSQYDSVMETIGGLNFQPVETEQFRTGSLYRMMNYMRDPTADSHYAEAVAALDNQATKDLVGTLGVQAAEYWDNSEGDRDSRSAMDNLSAMNAIFMAANDDAREAWTKLLDQHSDDSRDSGDRYTSRDRSGASDEAAAGDQSEAGDRGASADSAPSNDQSAAAGSSATDEAQVADDRGSASSYSAEFKEYAEGVEGSWADHFSQVYQDPENATNIQAMIHQIPAGDSDRTAAEYFFGDTEQAMVANNLERWDMSFSVLENILGANDNTAEAWQDFKLDIMMAQLQEPAASS